MPGNSKSNGKQIKSDKWHENQGINVVRGNCTKPTITVANVRSHLFKVLNNQFSRSAHFAGRPHNKPHCLPPSALRSLRQWRSSRSLGGPRFRRTSSTASPTASSPPTTSTSTWTCAPSATTGAPPPPTPGGASTTPASAPASGSCWTNATSPPPATATASSSTPQPAASSARPCRRRSSATTPSSQPPPAASSSWRPGAPRAPFAS